MTDILHEARDQVLAEGKGLDQDQVLRCLRLPAERLAGALSLAHQVRMRWCGPEVEVEGIVSVKTGGCPEDCHFCSQSGQFSSPVRSVWLDIPELVEAAKATAVRAITEQVGINVACSLGILTPAQAAELAGYGVHRYNHNLETARSFFGQVVTTHSWAERHSTCALVKQAGLELCCGGIIGMGESVEQRAEFAAQLASLGPDEVPLNFLNPRPGTPLAGMPLLAADDALRTIAAFRLALPRTVLRYAGGRELTLGDLGTEAGMLGGINAIIVGNYLTTLGRPADRDLDMLDRLKMPIKALSATL